jgi:hypothetical protein
MKPKTELHGIVNKQAHRLNKPSSKQLKWAFKELFWHYIYITKKKNVCLSCNHEWIGSKIDKCPNCKNELKLLDGKERTRKDSAYYSSYEIHDGFQVIRCFYIRRYLKSGFKAHHSIQEVFQHWISPEGKQTIRAVLVNGMSWGYYDGWVLGSPMEIRNRHPRYEINGTPVAPGEMILPNIYRNGFKGDYHKINIPDLFGILLRNPIAETFIKSGQIEMLRLLISDERRFTKYYHAYKICMRHKVKIKDISTWLDHMELLTYFKYDTHNPKFIFPTFRTFMQEHQRLYLKKKKIDNRRYQEKVRLDRIKAEKETKERNEREKRELKIALSRKKKFIDLKFSDGVIDIVALTTIDDFKIEGEVMNHCVYNNKYYTKDKSLILSARKEDQRLETIEIDLNDIKVIQCRGKDNQPSEYHKEIMKLINSSLTKLKQIA